MRLLEFTISCACRLHSLLLGCVAFLSNFSSVLLPCLCTSNHTQHAITQRQQHKFSLVGYRARTCTLQPLEQMHHTFFCFPFHKVCLVLKAWVSERLCSLSSIFAFLNTFFRRMYYSPTIARKIDQVVHHLGCQITHSEELSFDYQFPCFLPTCFPDFHKHNISFWQPIKEFSHFIVL